MGLVIKETELSHTWKTQMKIKLSHRAESRYSYSKKSLKSMILFGSNQWQVTTGYDF